MMTKDKRKTLKLVAILSAGAAILSLLAVLLYYIIVQFAPIAIKLFPDCEYQEIDGFGASSAWVYQTLGLVESESLKDDATDMLYGDDGLCLNVFRYNIGAGGRESDNYPDYLRGAESYFVAEKFDGDYSVFRDRRNYDFSRDVGVRDLLERALKTGNIRKVVFFANSPHYLMTQNGKTHAENAKQNNLKEECYQAFSDYLIVIANEIYTEVVCKYDPSVSVFISPVNEPQWKWGGDGATQEGCHFDAKPMAKFCDVFYRTLAAFNRENGRSFRMDIFESGDCRMKNVKPYINELRKYDWFDDVAAISVHSYNTELKISARKRFCEYMQKTDSSKKTVVSEYCVMRSGVDDGIETGLYSAKIMLRDFKYLRASEWNWWLSVSNGDYEDGLVYWQKDSEGRDKLRVTKRYYTFGHFSKYVTGSKMIKCSHVPTNALNKLEAAAFKRADGSIALTVINDEDRARKISIKYYCGNVRAVVTDASADMKETAFEYGGCITLGAKSITTLILFQ